MEKNYFSPDANRLVLQARQGASIKHLETVNSDMIALTIIVNRREVAKRVCRTLGMDLVKIQEQALERIDSLPSSSNSTTPTYSLEVKAIFRESAKRDSEGELIEESITTDRLLEVILRHRQQEEDSLPETLSQFCVDWTALAAKGSFSPVAGRDSELALLERSLLRKTKNNPVLVGDAGVGKTAIVEGLAIKIESGEVPLKMQSMKLLSLDIVKILSTGGPAVVKEVLEDAGKRGNVILFIDEFHCLNDSSRSMNLVNILKPILARGALKIIGATTAEEYSRYIESDKAFERRLQKIDVGELSPEDTITVLNTLRPGYERYHGIRIDDEAIKVTVKLSQRYVGGRCQPDKSIDIIDEAGAKASIAGKRIVTEDDIREVVTSRTGIPANRLCEDDYERLLRLENRLADDVIGQGQAVNAVAEAIKRSRAGLFGGRRPIGSFLFVGPTGVGKTELAKSLANHFAGSQNALVRIDMSEYQQEFSVSRLIGSPPGYVGYDQGGQLTEAVHRKPCCVILLDEVEKAHPKVFELLLQVLDDGRLTDGRGRVIDFSNAMIILTSNLGTSQSAKFRTPIGFNTAVVSVPQVESTMEAVRQHFSPEFLNRLDGIIHFMPLERHTLELIARKKLNELCLSLMENGYELTFDESVVSYVVNKGVNSSYGARPVRRAVENTIAGFVTNLILTRTIVPGVCFSASMIEGEFTVTIASHVD